MNVEKIASAVSESFQSYFEGVHKTISGMAKVVVGLEERLKAVESKEPVHGKDGKDADPVDVSAVARELVGMPELRPILDLLATEAVEKHLEDNPIPAGKDGADGKDGEKGDPGDKGDPGEKGDPGRDGLDVKDMFRADGGRLMAVLSDGTTKDLGRFVGADGKDGKDGVGFEDCTVEVSDSNVTMKYRRGETQKTVTYPIPNFKHIGFWGPNMSARAGDFTTHDGHLWLAKRDTSENPGYKCDDWQLAARKGADGPKGKDGKDLKPQEPVKVKTRG